MTQSSRFRSLVPLLAFLLVSCASPDEPVDTRAADTLIARGKEQLAKGEWSNAKASFTEAYERYDRRAHEARFGAALADILWVSDIVRYVGSLVEVRSESFLPLAQDDESRYLNQLVTEAIQTIRGKFAAAATQLAWVENNDRLTFRIESLPLHLTPEEKATIDLGGEWDRADAILLHGLVRIVLGLLDSAASVDLRFDFPRAHAYITQADFDAGNLEHLFSLLTYLLNDPGYPNFLGLADDGVEKLALALESFTLAGRDLKLAFYTASRETDDQRDDVLRFLDENGNRRFDPPLDPDADACALVAELISNPDKGANVVDSFALFDLRLRSANEQALLNQRLFCLLQKLQVNLGWTQRDRLGKFAESYTERPRINVINDLLPLADAFLAGLSSALPQITFGIPVPEGILTILVKEIVGDSFELDPHAFYSKNAAGEFITVRGLLPAWEKADCEYGALCLNSFHIEMECSPIPVTEASFPVPITVAIPTLGPLPVCRGSWVVAGQVGDSEHFGGKLAADGIVGYLPYIDFQDPTFHGLLHLNVGATGLLYQDSTNGQNAAIAAALQTLDGNASDFKPATLAELNAIIAALSANDTVSGLLLGLADE